ncbi:MULTISPECIES: SIS domain-containing protein [Anaerotruncus]|uniref:SIS domain-containing protein n=2 Tax=Anaerotruncus TaxID=244127 RepID=A0A498CPD9_9FIRM|nr:MULTISPECIES: SIS domain-containing protein [Anaerotruncus]MBC3938170.1 SIS domain-containing protein [Anaerotruncus massiliensis (ex Togo et al. 2019)]MCQ4896062.1 SIS domain-containing protein [Anaerotruncus sp. DFI.9.16]RLL13236.1 SIS domain-containing protein [Anaerotruncus massiliensis (ex Liu et al. 2021)]
MREFTARAREAFDQFVDGVEDAEYVKAAELILASRQKGGRLHITGIGKPGHVSGYGASLLSSTGTPTYFLHGTEAVHGSCGQLVPGDVVICISNSGETAEMKTTVTAIKNNGCEVIGVSGNPDSWLAKQSAAHLFAGVCCEGGPLNRAPRASILAENFVLQRLSVLLQANRGLDPKQYVMWHPGGTLGQLRDNEK